MHLYPKFENFKLEMRVRGQEEGMNETSFREHVIPLTLRLAVVISEIQWNAWLNPYNHHTLFPTIFTGILDTFPIRVSCAFSSRVQYLFYVLFG